VPLDTRTVREDGAQVPLLSPSGDSFILVPSEFITEMEFTDVNSLDSVEEPQNSALEGVCCEAET
jgi:hypothetical protein